jgi:predicted nucleic acid-binding protein
MSFIANNTVLSNFAGIGRLDILKRIFRTLRISEEVWLEIKQGLEAGYSYQDKTLKDREGDSQKKGKAMRFNF